MDNKKSTLQESLIDLKNIEKEAMEIAKAEVLESVAPKIKEIQERILKQRLNEDEENKEEVVQAPIMTEPTEDVYDTVLDDVLDFEISVDTKDGDVAIDGKQCNCDVVDADANTAEVEPKTIDMTGSDIEQVMEAVRNLGDEDEIEIKETNENMENEKIQENSEATFEFSGEELQDLENAIKEEMEGLNGSETPELDEVPPMTENSDENAEMSDEELNELSDVVAERLKEELSVDNLDDLEIVDEPAEKEDEMEEGLSFASQTKKSVGSEASASREGAPERRSNMSESAEFKKLSEKVNAIIKENKELKELQKEYKTKIETFKGKLYEAAVTAEKTAYLNRLLLENSLSKDEKKTLAEKFLGLNSREEVKVMYESTRKEFATANSSKEAIVESKITKTISTGSSTLTEQTVVAPQNRMMELINYKKGK